MPKMVQFGKFFKTYSLRSNRVNRQVCFNESKIGAKCQNWKIQMRHFGLFSNTVSVSTNRRTVEMRSVKTFLFNSVWAYSIIEELLLCHFVFDQWVIWRFRRFLESSSKGCQFSTHCIRELTSKLVWWSSNIIWPLSLLWLALVANFCGL